MRIINKTYLVIILLIGIILTGVIIMKPKEKVQLDNVILKQEVDNKSFAMYVEKTDGYKEYDNQKFPEGYSLNLQLSKCIDNNGEELKDVLGYENGNVTITSGNTTYCYLYFDSIPTYIMRLYESFFHNDEYKNKIVNASFVDYINTENAVPNTINDLSENQDNSIIGWLETSKDNNEMYDLYIGSNRIIYVKDNALSGAFTLLSKLKNITFSNLNTNEATSISSMFRETSIQSIKGLKNLDLSNVTNINAMFQFSYFIENLDLSSIHNENILAMDNTFYDCYNLRYLNLKNINFEKIKNLSQGTFRSLKNVEIIVGTEKDKEIITPYLTGENVTITVAN